MSLTGIRSVTHPANQSIVDMLEDQLAETQSTNYKHTLRRALRAIRVYPKHISTKEEALKVPHVGQHIATQIQVHLLEQPSPPLPLSEPGAMLLPDRPDSPQPQPQPPSHPPRRPRAPGRSREYCPQFRSAAYGILIALYHAESSGIAAMRKDDLARSAQQYCDKPMLMQGSDDPSTWYGGWSCVNKTLVPKGLVARGGKPIKFSLSATGRELAEKLIETNNDVLTMGAREYRTDDAMDVGLRNLPIAGDPAAVASRIHARSVLEEAGVRRTASASQERSKVLSQEEADLEMARALQRQFDKESAAAPGASASVSAPAFAVAADIRQETPESGLGKEAGRPGSRPVIDAETAAALERQYRAGREFGAVLPGVPPSTPQRARSASQAQTRRRKLTPAQCDRATKAIQRLEASGFDRADCIKIIEILHAEKALPRTVDCLYQVIVKALWEAEKQDRRLGRSTEPIGLNISAMDSDDDSIMRDAEETVREGVHKDSQLMVQKQPLQPSSVPSEFVFRESSATRIKNEPEARRASEKGTKDAVVIIDLDEDSVIDIRSPGPLKQPHRLTAANPPKRPRVSGVITIDSDEEGMVTTNRYGAGRNPLESTSKCSFENQSSSLRKPQAHCQSEAPSEVTSNGNPGTSSGKEVRMNIQGPVAANIPETNIAHVNDIFDPPTGQECRVVLLLDSMERFRNSSTRAGHVKSPGELLLEEGVNCEVRTLPTGDALFVGRFHDGSEVVLDYIIERKTVEDYAASMKDGRVARQSYLMRHAKIKRQVFLLEGDLKDNDELYNSTELHKKLAEMTMCSGLYVKHTIDIQDTVYFYASLFRRLQRKFLKQSRAMALRERSLFPNWLDRMNTMKKSLTLGQLFMVQLCQIPGVGMTKAQAIIEMGYVTPFLLHMAYKRLDSQEKRDEMLNKGEHAIGSASSKAVSRLFTQREYPTIVKPSPHR